MNLSASMSPRNELSQYKNIIVFLAIFSLSACANMSEEQKIRGQATGTGAAVGAAGGATVLEDNRLLGALVGGAVGGIAGYVVGDQQVDHIHQMDQKSGEKETLTSRLQQENALISRYNYGLKQQIDQFELDIIKKIDRREEARMYLKTAQGKRKKLQLVIVEEQQKTWGISDSTLRKLEENQLEKLRGEIKVLDRSISRLRTIGYGRLG